MSGSIILKMFLEIAFMREFGFVFEIIKSFLVFFLKPIEKPTS